MIEHDENINDPGARVVIKADRFTNAHHRGVLNAPQHEDFAAVVSDERLAGLADRDVKIQLKGGPSTENMTDIAATATTAEITGKGAVGQQ